MYVKSAINFVENFKFILLSNLIKMKVYYEHQVKYNIGFALLWRL